MDQFSMAELVLYANHYRQRFAAAGHDFLRPREYLAQEPRAAALLIDAANHYRDQGDALATGAVMVWAQTVRATVAPELLPLARNMWAQVARGFPVLEATAPKMKLILAPDFDPTGADSFPAGFGPADR
jgi:hypothetical protein